MFVSASSNTPPWRREYRMRQRGAEAQAPAGQRSRPIADVATPTTPQTLRRATSRRHPRLSAKPASPPCQSCQPRFLEPGVTYAADEGRRSTSWHIRGGAARGRRSRAHLEPLHVSASRALLARSASARAPASGGAIAIGAPRAVTDPESVLSGMPSQQPRRPLRTRPHGPQSVAHRYCSIISACTS